MADVSESGWWTHGLGREVLAQRPLWGMPAEGKESMAVLCAFGHRFLQGPFSVKEILRLTCVYKQGSQIYGLNIQLDLCKPNIWRNLGEWIVTHVW